MNAFICEVENLAIFAMKNCSALEVEAITLQMVDPSMND